MTQVVDFARLKRLQLPEETGGLSYMTKVYMCVIALAVVLFVKKYRDIRKERSRLSETF
jgi:hypothetical protein